MTDVLKALADHPRYKQLSKKFGDGQEPPDNGDMEARVAKLEALAEKTGERLVAIEKDLAVIKSNYATKEDVTGLRGDMKAAVAEAKNSIILWVVGAIILTQVVPQIPALFKAFGG